MTPPMVLDEYKAFTNVGAIVKSLKKKPEYGDASCRKVEFCHMSYTATVTII